MEKFTINVADTAGFCFGVDRAVNFVYNILEEKCLEASCNETNCHIATLGEMIHNPDVVERLKKTGVRIIDSIAEARDGEHVVIRSHGVGTEVYRQLEERGLRYTDGTCPFVKRIQDIAREASMKGVTPVIMGDKNHPEIIGIAGHCEGTPAVILADDRELENFLEENPDKPFVIVVQTTYNTNTWERCREICERFPKAECKSTICAATVKRQQEAAELARKSDVMIIVGGAKSSNTKKLYQICKEHCPVCIAAENAASLKSMKMPDGVYHKCDIRIGITAGASTPAYIIKEVKTQMSEILENKNMDEDFNFEEALDASFKRIYTGNRVKGYITAVNNTEAIVDVGTKHTGYIALSELTHDPSLKPSDVVKVGDEVDLIVVKINDAEGIVQLSKIKADAMKGLDTIAKAKEEGTVLEGVVTGVVKGGVIVISNGVRVFIPASQASVRRDEKLENLVKTNVKFKVIEVNETRGKAVGSIRQVASAERDEARQKFWENVKVGDVFKGEVKSITSYGAFVDLGGIDGMVHISELSWDRIKHPSEAVSVGDVLEVYVKDLDREKDRISLGYKKEADSPWVKFNESYSEGDVVKATVVSITSFGAFARIIPGIDGLIHISQVSEKRVTSVKDVLSVGDEVTVKITEIDSESKRISLSIRAILEEGGEETAEEE
ncbi:MAG: bifunctional 4-hydroxy-3-methylbut-2-enyl diphosphate reductase/30S ribosomal protein S1 [Oscillospiraceae bacterium]|nr:bifunctional 4-hydroxy-3-methylbut-2-enyl diphosphate reductase/30S ribosomal protein S1 [Oscillospiraceae bacterium]